ncbi:MAG: hypothetical protein AB8F26_06220 [Phycisphaerales bacterium]
MWVFSEIADGIVAGLTGAERQLAEEQAVAGLDSMREIDLHPLIARSIEDLGYGIEREAVFPGQHAAAVKRSARARCDVVVLPEAGRRLEDPAAEQAVLLASEGTLFDGLADEMGPLDEPVAAGEALWLEIKGVAQHAYVEGVPGPNRLYGSKLVRGVMEDVVKLASDPSLWHAAAVMLLFAESEEIARHDLAAVAHQLLDDDVPVGVPEIRGTPILDRVGNAWCGVGVYPVKVG